MIVLMIFLAIIVYFIIGRTVINLLEDNEHVDFDDWKVIAILIFPLILIWLFIVVSADYITDEIDKMNNK